MKFVNIIAILLLLVTLVGCAGVRKGGGMRDNEGDLRKSPCASLEVGKNAA